MRFQLIICLFFIAILAACGGSGKSPLQTPGESERVLHLRGFDITESHWRLTVRKALSNQALGAVLYCREVLDINTQEEYQAAFGTPNPSETPPPLSTSRPNQEPSGDDSSRALAIIKDECRFFTSPTPQ